MIAVYALSVSLFFVACIIALAAYHIVDGIDAAFTVQNELNETVRIMEERKFIKEVSAAWLISDNDGRKRLEKLL